MIEKFVFNIEKYFEFSLNKCAADIYTLLIIRKRENLFTKMI